MLISSQKIIVSNFSITINHAVGFYNKEFMQGSFSWYTEIITLTNQLQNRHFVILAIRLVIYILLILFFAPPPLGISAFHQTLQYNTTLLFKLASCNQVFATQ